MPDEPLDLYRKLEPVSRLLRALGVPPPEAVIPTPAEVMSDLGAPAIEDLIPPIKDDIRRKIITTVPTTPPLMLLTLPHDILQQVLAG